MSNGTAFARPAPPHDPEPGTRWEAVPADPHDWAPAPDGKPCRWRGGDMKHACGQPAVIAVMHGIKRRVPWYHCAEHSYGRWVEDVKGKPAVMEWHMVDVPRRKPPK